MLNSWSQRIFQKEQLRRLEPPTIYCRCERECICEGENELVNDECRCLKGCLCETPEEMAYWGSE